MLCIVVVHRREGRVVPEAVTEPRTGACSGVFSLRLIHQAKGLQWRRRRA
jgi:hypothetical protein